MATPSTMPSRPDEVKLVDLQAPKGIPPRLFSWVKPPIEKVFSLDTVNEVYRGIRQRIPEQAFFDASLAEMDVEYTVSEEDLKRIPVEGPLVVVANHPFGGLEGLILGSLLTSIRSDVKLMGNYLLQSIPEIRPNLISVDPFGGKDSRRANIGPLKDSIRLLRSGGVLVTFPSGEVSSLKLNKRGVTDPDWTTHTASLVKRTSANVLPIFFEGRNSNLFQLMGLVHPRLRTVLLAHEMFKRRGSSIPVQVGNPISYRKLQKMEEQEMTDYLRVNTYILKNRSLSDRRPISIRFPRVKRIEMDEVIPAIERKCLKEELASLPSRQKLVSEKEFEVYFAEAHQIPNMLREIGRLREETFREINEGTGKALDVDKFDDTYTQLFLWNRKSEELVGGYRIGHLDTIMKGGGKKGLYTNTLFKFKPGFLEQLGMALELGRSFIRSEYQRKFGCLTLLWKGIGGYISLHPDYHVLFGPVSISRDYHAVSKNLMVQFLKEHNRFQDLAKLVKPRNPHRTNRIGGVGKKDLRKTLRSIDDVSALISEIEHDGKSIPVLLRHYLKLNAQLLSFNVDKDFSDVLDGLVLVDLKNTDPKMVKRYMGEKKYAAYSRRHHLGE
jgi:putative hemolysin